jgi:hypothetical protein
MPPWKVTGERLTNWRRQVWKARHELYMEHVGKQHQRQAEENEKRMRQRRGHN